MVFSGPYYIVILNKNHILFTDFTEKMKKNNYQIDFWHMDDEVMSFGNFIATYGLSTIELDCFIARLM